MQSQIAEGDCRRAESKLHEVQARNAALAARKAETRRSVSRAAEFMGGYLSPLTGWYGWTLTEHSRLMGLERNAAEQVEKCRAAFMEAQRKVRLLEKLHDNRLADWQVDFDRELEELAADSINSRYAREAEIREHSAAEDRLKPVAQAMPAELSRRSLSHPSSGNAGPETYK